MAEPATDRASGHMSLSTLAHARRLQTLIDVGVALALTMLAWPFPVARANLSAPTHVVGIAGSWILFQSLYFAVSAASWSQTLGMRLAGLRLVAASENHHVALSRLKALRWGVLAALIAPWFLVTPAAATKSALAERAAGVRMVVLQAPQHHV